LSRFHSIPDYSDQVSAVILAGRPNRHWFVQSSKEDGRLLRRFQVKIPSLSFKLPSPNWRDFPQRPDASVSR
jgi:hypothetical protein